MSKKFTVELTEQELAILIEYHANRVREFILNEHYRHLAGQSHDRLARLWAILIES